MPYSLVPMVANAAPGPFGVIGTHPLSLDFGGHALILDATIAYAWTPDLIPDPRATWICDQKDDIVTGAARAALQALVPGRVMGARFSDIVGDMLKTPPPGKWNPLKPHQGRGQLEILLGPGEFLGSGVGNPGLLWSEPAAVGGPHSKDIQDSFDRADGNLGGSTSSDAQFTWQEEAALAGTTGVARIASNQASFVRGTGDGYWTMRTSLQMDTADHYALVNVTRQDANCYAGVIMRCDAAPGAHGYMFTVQTVDDKFVLYDIVTPTVIRFLPAGGVATGNVSFEMSGTTYVGKVGGVTIMSGTELTHTGAVGERRTGTFTGTETTAGRTVLLNNFRAADFVSPQPALQREQQAMIIREAWLGAY